MRRLAAVLVLAAVTGCGKTPDPTPPVPAAPTTAAAPEAPAAPAAAAISEKQKAQTEPFANDAGPATLSEDQLKAYAPALRAGYDLMVIRCAQCHTPARPLNSEIVEADAWKRYVKRMMAKPGCNIAPAEGKQIWTFLVEDSKVRKTGANSAGWKAHRKALLYDYKVKHPDRYKVLYADKPGGGM
jgi:hypothetical protein